MVEIDKDILVLLRNNARYNLSHFSRKKGISIKKSHYEFSKIKKDVDKFVSFLDFEALGFIRMLVIFFDAVEGLTFSSTFKPFFINNSVRLDTGLFVEYIFFSKDEQQEFLDILKKKKIRFDNYFVEEVIKQECFLPN